MAKSVAEHLKGLMSNGIMGTALNFASGLTQSTSGAQGKVAAQLLKKSPFEINDSPVEAAKRDPLQFSFISYPRDLATAEVGHYILFYTLKNKFSAGTNKDLQLARDLGFASKIGPHAGMTSVKDLRKVGGSKIKPVKTDNSVLSKFPTHTQVTSAIALYMPPGVKVNYGQNYGAEATELSGTTANTIGIAKSAVKTTDQLKAIIGGVAGGLGQYGKNIVGEALSMVGAGDPIKLASKAFGVAVNPHEEMFYEGPSFREFSYAFDFYPRDEKEMKDVQNIVKLFKYHQAPDLDMSKYGGRLFNVPSEFEIHYMYQDRVNNYMNKISKVACKGVDVQYGEEEQFSTFKPDADGAPPVSTKLTLNFVELELMTKEKIYRGF
mgnify:CR=1 FL=1|tara:strand:- start:765 stop:1901 length:1137 start_codon:yes stop_codon:yes gene_type:complete